MIFIKSLTLSIVMIFLGAGCASTPCHQANASEVKSVTATAAPAINSEKIIGSGDSKIFVFKPDGSLQCGKGKAIAPKIMEKELKGILISSSRSDSDGMMHTQMCGSATGKINIFEILEHDLTKAESLGFKRWNPK